MSLFSQIRDSLAASIATLRDKEKRDEESKRIQGEVKKTVEKVKSKVTEGVGKYTEDLKKNPTSTPQERVVRLLAENYDHPLMRKVGQTLQKFPEIKIPENIQETIKKSQERPIIGIGPFGIGPKLPAVEATNFAVNLPGEIVRGYGKTAENLSTKEGVKQLIETPKRLVENFKTKGVNLQSGIETISDPGVQDVLNLTDFLPGGLVAGLAVGSLKAVSREGGEKLLKEIAEKGIKAIPEELAPVMAKAGAFNTAEDFIKRGLSNLTDIDKKAIEKAGIGLRDLFNAAKAAKLKPAKEVAGFASAGKLIDESRFVKEVAPKTVEKSIYNLSKSENGFDVISGSGDRIGQFVGKNGMGAFRIYDSSGKEHLLANVSESQLIKNMNSILQKYGVLPDVSKQSVGDIITAGTSPMSKNVDDIPLVSESKLPVPEAPPGMKERKFITSVREKPGAAPEIKEKIKGFYKELPDDPTIMAARTLVQNNPDEALRIATEQGPASAAQNAVRMELASKYQREGNFEAALNMLEDTTAKAATLQGQAIQILSAWGRLTPEGALRYAQRVIRKAAPEAKRFKAEEVAKSLSEEMTKVNTGVIDQVVNDIKQIADAKGITKRLKQGAKKEIPLIAEERLAKRVEGYVTPNIPKKIDPKEEAIKNMVDTLFKVAKQTLPERTKNIKDPVKLLGEAIKDRKNYGEVWTKAQALVKEKFAGNEEALTAIDDYINQLLTKPFSEADINKVINIGIKSEGIDIGDIVRKHYSEVNKANQSLSDRLISEAGLEAGDAKYLADEVKKKFEILTKDKKESILNNLFAERKINKKEILERILEYSNLGAFDTTKFLPDVSKKLKIPALTPELGKEITDLANKVQELPEGSRERIIATAKLMDKIAEQIPASLASRISTFQTLAQLLNPKTFIRNLVGNLGFAGVENVKDLVAYPVDLLTSVATGQKTKALPSLVTQAQGVKKGFKLGLEDALNGINTAVGATQFELPKKLQVFSGIGDIGKKIDKGLQTMLDVELRATDRAFFQSAYEESLRQSMRSAGLAEPTEAMVQQAVQDGLYRTFQDDTVASKIFSGIKKALNAGKEFGLGDLVLKYPKTPANILSRAIDYSPAGFLSATYELARPFITGDAFRQKKFVEEVSRALTGTFGLIGTGAILHKLGIITGSPEAEYGGDADLEAEARRAGLGEYRLNASALSRFVLSGFKPDMAKPTNGDLIVSYDWFQPQSISLAMGADIDANKATAQGFVGQLLSGIAAGSQTLVEQPLVTGLETLFRYGDLSKGMMAVLASAPNSMIPTILNQVRQLSNNTARNTTDPNLIKYSLNQAQMKIPFLANKLPARIDTRGIPQETYQNGTNNVFNVFFNPAFVSRLNMDPVGKEVFEIFKESGETQQTPRLVSRTIEVNGKSMKLNGAQIGEMQKYVGRVTNDMFSKAAADPRFQALPPEKQAEAWSNMMSDVFQAAKIELLGHRPKTISAKVRGILMANRNREDVSKSPFEDLPLISPQR